MKVGMLLVLSSGLCGLRLLLFQLFESVFGSSLLSLKPAENCELSSISSSGLSNHICHMKTYVINWTPVELLVYVDLYMGVMFADWIISQFKYQYPGFKLALWRYFLLLLFLFYSFLNLMPLVPVIILAIDLFASFQRQSIVSGKAVNVCAPSRQVFSPCGELFICRVLFLFKIA